MGLFDFIKRLKPKNANNNQRGCKSAEQRKRESIEFLKEQGIEYLESLPFIEDASEVELKDVGTLVYNEDFEVAGYQDNVKKGTMKVYIRGKGDKCSGTKMFKVKISPKAMKKAE